VPISSGDPPGRKAWALLKNGIILSFFSFEMAKGLDMMTTPLENNVRGHWKSWLFLAFIILFVVFVRVRLLEFPLERDEGEYAYMGQLMHQGISPYISAYNMKFPGTYAMYALIMSIFGQDIQGIHVGLTIVNCATVLLVFLLVRKLISEVAALTASAAYALLSLSPSVLGFAGHATHFVVLPALGGVLVLLSALKSDKLSLYFWSGTLFALAVLMKQPGIFFFLFGAAYILYHHFALARRTGTKSSLLFPQPAADALNPPSSPLNLRGEQRGVTDVRGGEGGVASSLVSLTCKLGTFAAGGAVPLLITFVSLYAAGAFDRFWFWTFEYAAKYGSQVPLSGAFDVFKKSVSGVTEDFLFLWLMPIPGLISILFYPGLKGKRFFIVLFTFFSFLSICPGFYFRSHYFITLLPALAILTGIFVEWLNVKCVALFKTEYLRFSGTVIFILAAGIGIAAQRGYLFEEAPTKLARTVYGANPFPESLEIAKFIESNSAVSDRIAVFGSEPQLFFYSGRHSATGYIYVYSLMESHEYSLSMQKEMIREIMYSDPKFIVVVSVATSWLMSPDSERFILNWLSGYIRDHYRLVGVADIISPETTVYKWHTDAQAYAIQSPSHVLIFEKNRE
jgi:hypothetical protein